MEMQDNKLKRGPQQLTSPNEPFSVGGNTGQGRCCKAKLGDDLGLLDSLDTLPLKQVTQTKDESASSAACRSMQSPELDEKILTESFEKATGNKPRAHQVDVVKKLLAQVKKVANLGKVSSYLLQHAPGSRKSLSISLLVRATISLVVRLAALVLGFGASA